jgi:hypothetical protein
MKVVFHQTYAEFIKEEADPKFYSDSRLMYFLKKQLKAMGGFDLIKKLMHKDGNLVDDCQHYIRTRRPSDFPSVAIYDGSYAISSAYSRWNQGRLDLECVYGWFGESAGEDLMGQLPFEIYNETISHRLSKNTSRQGESQSPASFLKRIRQDFA